MKKHTRKAYAKVLNTHDPHNQCAWAEEKIPWRLVLKIIATGIVMFALFTVFTIIMFQLG